MPHSVVDLEAETLLGHSVTGMSQYHRVIFAMCQHQSLMVRSTTTVATHVHTPETQPAACLVYADVHFHPHTVTQPYEFPSLLPNHSTSSGNNTHTLLLLGPGQTKPRDIHLGMTESHPVKTHSCW